MLYCANCLHCKVKVEKGGSYANGIFKPRYFRVCYCAKDVTKGPWVNNPFRKWGSLQCIFLDQCEYYEPIEPEMKGWEINRLCVRSVTIGGLEHYYNRDKYKNLKHDHNISRPVLEIRLPKYHRFERKAVKPQRFSATRLITDEEFMSNSDNITIWYNILTKKRLKIDGMRKALYNEIARNRKVG